MLQAQKNALPLEQGTIPQGLRVLIDERDWEELARRRSEWPEPGVTAPEVHDLLIGLEKHEQALFYRALPQELVAELLPWLDSDTAARLLLELSDPETRAVLSNLDADDQARLLKELPAETSKRLISLLSPEDRAATRDLLGYPEESVGRLMNLDYVAVRPDWNIARAIEEVRAFGRENSALSVIYVTDEAGVLVDALPLQRFVISPPDRAVRDIMDNTFVYVSAYEDREKAVYIMQRYDQVALPVVDAGRVLIGVVTVDDIMDVAEAEITEDFHRSAAVKPLRRSYWNYSPFLLVRSRIGWLVGLVFVHLLSAGVLSAYEHVMAQYVTLTFFIPLVIATGGNSGIQSATMIIRSMSTGEVYLSQWLRVLLKEALAGLGIGVLLGGLGFVLGVIIGTGPGIGIQVGSVVACTLLSIIVATNLFSALLPFVLTKLKLDPALASGPFITSVVDVIGLVIYFAWSTYFLIG
jgi:magnesium transporter